MGCVLDVIDGFFLRHSVCKDILGELRKIHIHEPDVLCVIVISDEPRF